MNIKIVNSWLKDFLETTATPSQIARELSLRSVSVEKTEKIDEDFVYEIEITTNRVDLMSVRSLAKEAAVDLESEDIKAKFNEIKPQTPREGAEPFPIEIKVDPKLVNRIKAVALEIEIGKSPTKISKRLELSGIRSLNNVIDVTNYVMREIGHPAHVFDLDLLATKKMIIRESKPGEEVTTLDGKKYRLYGGDIVADDGTGTIIDLLGVMGTANSVVNEKTKKILYFLDNNNPTNIRKTSMGLGIRTEAAIINEKGIDPELVEDAFDRGLELYQQIAKGKVISKFYEYYPNKSKTITIKVSNKKINELIGVEISPTQSKKILEGLGFNVNLESNFVIVKAPSIRSDIQIEEDVIEEIARIYGYHKLPSVVPTFLNNKNVPYANNFYFEERIKTALKYWGFVETYTYSLISENQYLGPIDDAVKLKNPLTEDMVYLRNSLIPSLLKVIDENKAREDIKIFELANTYHKVPKKLPIEKLTLGGVVKSNASSFFNVKGIIEALLKDIGIDNLQFKPTEALGATIHKDKQLLGYIELLENNLIDFELNFDAIVKLANTKKVFKPLGKFPPIVEDITLVLDFNISTSEISNEIQNQSELIKDVSLKDQFEDNRTFHIVYQSEQRNLTNEEITQIRDRVKHSLSEKYKAVFK